jgi:hypothetical protein
VQEKGQVITGYAVQDLWKYLKESILHTVSIPYLEKNVIHGFPEYGSIISHFAVACLKMGVTIVEAF